MDRFEECLHWLDTVDAGQRTLAWLALGHAFETQYLLHWRSVRHHIRSAVPRTAGEWLTHFDHLGATLAAEPLTWRAPDDTWQFPRSKFDELLGVPAGLMAQIIDSALARSATSVLRVRVQTRRNQFDARWLEPLHKPHRVRLALSLRYTPGAKQVLRPTSGLDVLPVRLMKPPGWPLKIGFLGYGSGSDRSIGLPQADDPFVVSVTLGRRHNRCDLLIYPGDSAQLLADLQNSPLKLSATILLFRNEHPSAPLDRISEMLGISGYASFGDMDYSSVFHRSFRLARELADEAHFDQAWASCFNTEIVPWLSHRLANWSLSDFNQQFGSGSARVGQYRPAPLSSLQTRRQPASPTGTAVSPPSSNDRFDIAKRLAYHVLALERAPRSPNSRRRGAQRFLQQQANNVTDGIEQPADNGFLHGHTVRLRVRIAAPDGAWQSLAQGFPEPDTDPGEPAHLDVWLAEPEQIGEPLRGTLLLPTEGASSVHLFEFTPRLAGDFQARLVVLHRGRVLQTAMLLAQVCPADQPPVHDSETAIACPRLESLIRPRKRIDDLRERTQFDLAIVENHLPGGEARTVALSSSAAWILRDFNVGVYSGAIHQLLSSVAETPDRYATTTSRKSSELLCGLARFGANLRQALLHTSLSRPGNNPHVAGLEYIQLVTARGGQTLPLEFVYEFEPPDDHATLCPFWNESARSLSCPDACPGGSAQVICPNGFWGISKVIERHQTSGEHAGKGYDFFLQSEPDRAIDSIELGDKLLLATSRVLNDEVGELEQQLRKAGASNTMRARDWKSWAEMVEKENPRLILCLAHTQGEDLTAKLEINDDYLMTVLISQRHISLPPVGEPPVVLLLGCDTMQASRDFSPHVMQFSSNGAAIVVATNCIVDADQAAKAATILVATLCKSAHRRTSIGECMRTFRRAALAQGLLLALGIVAFGDADWYITD